MICKCSTVVNCERNKEFYLVVSATFASRMLTWCRVENIRGWRWWSCWQSWRLDGWWAVAISYRCAIWPWATCRRVRSRRAGTISTATSGTDTWTLGSAILVRYFGNRKASKVSDQMCIVNYSSLPSVHWELPSGWTLTANCPEYELKPELAPPVGDLGMEYRASARSAARFKIISFGSLSGSPGWRGISFCNRWNP